MTSPLRHDTPLIPWEQEASFIEGVAIDESYELSVDELLARARASVILTAMGGPSVTAPTGSTAAEVAKGWDGLEWPHLLVKTPCPPSRAVASGDTAPSWSRIRFCRCQYSVLVTVIDVEFKRCANFTEAGKEFRREPEHMSSRLGGDEARPECCRAGALDLAQRGASRLEEREQSFQMCGRLRIVRQAAGKLPCRVPALRGVGVVQGDRGALPDDVCRLQAHPLADLVRCKCFAPDDERQLAPSRHSGILPHHVSGCANRGSGRTVRG